MRSGLQHREAPTNPAKLQRTSLRPGRGTIALIEIDIDALSMHARGWLAYEHMTADGHASTTACTYINIHTQHVEESAGPHPAMPYTSPMAITTL